MQLLHVSRRFAGAFAMPPLDWSSESSEKVVVVVVVVVVDYLVTG